MDAEKSDDSLFFVLSYFMSDISFIVLLLLYVLCNVIAYVNFDLRKLLTYLMTTLKILMTFGFFSDYSDVISARTSANADCTALRV